MTDRLLIMAYLSQVQGLQLMARKVELTIVYYPDDGGFRVSLECRYDRHAFCVWSGQSEEENVSEMERLYKVFYKYEKQ